jgi:SSS family transporter
MSLLDWIVLAATIASVVLYGMYRSRQKQTMQSYLLANKQMKWHHICLSVMATQASAITFLSAPGQSFTDGMRFVQFYFGLPLAMIVLCLTFVPAFHRLRVYTAYEFLEKRFDHKTRLLTAFLFLLQRGISTGISIYAPSIILSAILNIHITYTTLFIGFLVMLYTIYGGTQAVSHSQVLQMTIIFFGILAAGCLATLMLSNHANFFDTLKIAGACGRMNVIDFSFDWNNRYNVWSGIIGGFFLQLSYFGTDQSQVGRYLTAKSIKESRIGLLANGILKIPMQFVILLIGIIVFSFYQFNSSPLFFNQTILNEVNTSKAAELAEMQTTYDYLNKQKGTHAAAYLQAKKSKDAIAANTAKSALIDANEKAATLKNNARALIKKENSTLDTNDSNYVFLYFVTHHFPHGFIGLLIAVIFLASMGSLAAGLNALASTTAVDVYIRNYAKKGTDQNNLNFSRLATLGWGLFCIGCALFASRVGNLIEAVNILGSLFYGTILGIFICAFYVKKINGTGVFIAALITELIVIYCWYYELLAFLWLNVAGCFSVILFGLIFSGTRKKQA